MIFEDDYYCVNCGWRGSEDDLMKRDTNTDKKAIFCPDCGYQSINEVNEFEIDDHSSDR